eukprot:129954-Amphidinium_carterae.2
MQKDVHKWLLGMGQLIASLGILFHWLTSLPQLVGNYFRCREQGEESRLRDSRGRKATTRSNIYGDLGAGADVRRSLYGLYNYKKGKRDFVVMYQTSVCVGSALGFGQEDGYNLDRGL